MDSKRIVIDTVDVEGKPLQLAVIRPTNRINTEANMAYNLRMAKLIRNGSLDSSNRLLLRVELEEYLSKMGIWTLQDEVEVEKLALEIRASELMIKQGGRKISEGRALALQMAEKRQMILEKHAKRLQFDSATIESQAENFRFEYLLIKCLVFADTGKPFFKSHDDYTEQQDEIAVMEGARVLANMVYGLDDSINKNMFEMKWLKEAGMIDDKGQYTRSDGKIIDRNGRLIDKNGRYINSKGQMIDTFGRSVDEHGNLLVDISTPFIDDETGEEVVICGIGKKMPQNNTIKKTSSRKGMKKKKKKIITKSKN